MGKVYKLTLPLMRWFPRDRAELLDRVNKFKRRRDVQAVAVLETVDVDVHFGRGRSTRSKTLLRNGWCLKK